MKCPVHGCQEKAPPRGILCPIHYCLVPESLRAKVRATFDPAVLPEEQGAPYLEAAALAVRAAGRADEVVKAAPHFKALSLWRPWAWLVASGQKPVENRGWAPWPSMVGQRLVIHAAQKIDREGAIAVRQEFGIEFPAQAWETGCVGVATLDRWFDSKADPTVEPMRMSQWYAGDIGWVFREAVLVPAVECPGAQGLWDVPVEVARRLWYRRAVELARKG